MGYLTESIPSGLKRPLGPLHWAHGALAAAERWLLARAAADEALERELGDAVPAGEQHRQVRRGRGHARV